MRTATVMFENIISAHKYVMMIGEQTELSPLNPYDFAKIVQGYQSKRKIEWYLGNRKVNSEVEYSKCSTL